MQDKFFAANIKNQIRTMIYFHRLSIHSSQVKTRKLTWNYLSICPDSQNNKKSLVQLGTPANIQK